MFQGKKVLSAVLLSVSAAISLLQAGQEQPVITTTNNIYSELYKIFAGQLSQNSPKDSTISGLAVIGLAPKPTNPLIKPAAKPVAPAENMATKLTQLLCIYCDIRAQQEAASATPIKQDIPVSALEKLGIVPTGTTSMNCTVLRKLSIPEGTVFGEVERAALFMRLPGFDELHGNQEITNYFASHDDVRRKALRAIEKIRSAQADFLWLFLAEEQKKDPFEDYYWSLGVFKKLNRSATGLAVGDLSKQLTQTLTGLIPPCAYLGAFSGLYKGLSGLGENRTDNLIANIFVNTAYIPIAIAKGFGEGLLGEVVGHWPGTYSYGVTTTDKTITLQNVGTFQYTSFGDRWAHLLANSCQENGTAELNTAFSIANTPGISTFNTLNQKQTEIIQKGVKTFPLSPWRGEKLAFTTALAGLAWRDTINILNARATYKKIREDLGAFRLAQARLMSIARLLEGLAELRTIAEVSQVKPLEALAKQLTDFEILRTTNKDFAKLCELLKTNTFKGEPSVFSNRARILLAHRLLRRSKRLFLPAIQSGAKIELFVSAAEFYAKHRTAGKPACLVDFVNEPQPRLELESCWNILVEEKDAVCLNINLGKNGSQHAIFSGPNGTGKSTHENAIAHAIFLGRLGIACASRATMTPFDIFAIHRNEQENIEKGDSSFMAQKARFDAICAEIAALTDKRMLIIMDEPLNGTVEEEAGRIIFEKCKELLANQKQAICILATHAKQPTELEAATNGAFANYYVKILELSDTEFKRTFELERGIPRWWFDDADRRHRFVEWLSHSRPAAAKSDTDISGKKE